MNTATDTTVSPLIALLGLPTQEEWDAGVGLNPKKPQYLFQNGLILKHRPELDWSQTASSKLSQHEVTLTQEEEDVIAQAPERNTRLMQIRTTDPDLELLDNMLFEPGNNPKEILRAYFLSKRTGQEGKILTYPVSFQYMGPEEATSSTLSDRPDRQVRKNAVRSVIKSQSGGSELGDDFDKRLQQEVDDHHGVTLDEIFNRVDITPTHNTQLDELQQLGRVNRTAEFQAREPKAVKVPYPTIGDYLKPVPAPSPTKLQLFISKLFYPEPKATFEPYRPLKKQDGRLYIDDCPHFQEKIQDTAAKRALMFLRDVPDQISYDLLSFKGLSDIVLNAVIDQKGKLCTKGVRELEQEGYYVLYDKLSGKLMLHCDRFQSVLLEGAQDLTK